MTIAGWLQIILYLVVLLILVKPLGAFMARVYQGEKTFLNPVLKPVERLLYRAAGVKAEDEMTWKTYAVSLLLFSAIGFLVVYALQRLQGVLPLNPQRLPAVAPASAFNTAISFITNTNWQGYGGETTLSYLPQMLGLAVQNFVSAAMGMAVLVALIRGLVRHSATTLGNFWVDLTRGILYILLPLALLLAVALVSQGVVQSFGAYRQVSLLQPVADANGQMVTMQTLPMGPAASQIAIKQLGTNGGGFFNVNSAHPFENPTPLANFLEMLSILLIPAALCYTFGKIVGDTRQGWAVLAAMTIVFALTLTVTVWAEQRGNPTYTALGIDQQASAQQPGGNMEGKELRFGIANSALWAVATTSASNGSVNSMHDSFMPLGGMIPMWLMQLGEVVYGGVGSGLYGMLVFVVIAVFVAGLMVGRTPEYLGKKIQAYEVKMAALVILVPIMGVLLGTALALMLPAGRATIFNNGPQGFSEVLYAFSSASNNNGSAFAGLGANTPFYNLTLGVVMFLARFWLKVPVLAMAGSLAAKKLVPAGKGTLPTHTPLFIGWLLAVVLVVGALSFLPALALGPIIQQLLLGTGEVLLMSSKPTFYRSLYQHALLDALLKLDPRRMVRNPVMFVVEVGSLLTTVLWVQALLGHGEAAPVFIGLVALWLWFTVFFANFSEALAEGRGKAQAAALRRTRRETPAKKLSQPHRDAKHEIVASTELRSKDVVLVEAGDTIPADGEVIEGIAAVDESAVTGESAPVIRESGGDRSAVTGGTRVLSDWLVVRITADPGEGFLDRVISLVEGAKRQKTPNEIALNILLASFTIIFLVVCATLLPYSLYSISAAGQGVAITITVLVALLVCLIPTTIGGLLSAIGIAGMDRLIRRNVIALSGRAVEAAGDVDVLLLDKTGTITLGNRQAVEFVPVNGNNPRDLAEAAQLASLADETPEGRSIVVLAKDKYGLRGRVLNDGSPSSEGMRFIPFTAQSRASGVEIDGLSIRKGAPDTIMALMQASGETVTQELTDTVEGIARNGGTPLVVTLNGRALGVVHLKDVVKEGIKERFAQLRRMGIKTVMITGDNPLTAAAIAAEAGVDDFLAQATPEAKLKLIREYQTGGRLVAMTGDGTNDAPALAQADVAVAMNTGTQPAREAANMVDLDSNPTKLIDVVQIGKQLLMTRGALTTFSIANDVSKYFAIIPAAFASTYPALGALNFMRLATPQSAILSAVIFNALIIVILIPLALRGVRYRAVGADKLLRDNLLVYGLGGLVAPFVGIKLIDLLLVALHLA